jgi:hypothetical protein
MVIIFSVFLSLSFLSEAIGGIYRISTPKEAHSKIFYELFRDFVDISLFFINL